MLTCNTVAQVHAHLAGVIAKTPGALQSYQTDFEVHDLQAFRGMVRGDVCYWEVSPYGTYTVRLAANPAKILEYTQGCVTWAEAVESNYKDTVLACFRIEYKGAHYLVREATLAEAVKEAKERRDAAQQAARILSRPGW